MIINDRYILTWSFEEIRISITPTICGDVRSLFHENMANQNFWLCHISVWLKCMVPTIWSLNFFVWTEPSVNWYLTLLPFSVAGKLLNHYIQFMALQGQYFPLWYVSFDGLTGGSDLWVGVFTWWDYTMAHYHKYFYFTTFVEGFLLALRLFVSVQANKIHGAVIADLDLTGGT